jgi:hypothetical protein
MHSVMIWNVAGKTHKRHTKYGRGQIWGEKEVTIISEEPQNDGTMATYLQL